MTILTPAENVKLKRIYEPPAANDGMRILVDRIWPRGVSKKDAALDLWMKEIAPSTELRKWFAHDPARWNEFRQRYAREVKQNHALSINCAPSRKMRKSHWFMPPMMQRITTPWH
ncbi:DUF488 domain-containing protein [Phyllobacterium sp. A18/5-2]|uniref:DUF488 domain-containing protein n=1 Tax=Phyllobacterium sp. A18/5-2 TaxID=2978392 RepID=UPI002905748C|nr:DUF488 family protein [Phyllobacterium sp. A18/5-2]